MKTVLWLLLCHLRTRIHRPRDDLMAAFSRRGSIAVESAVCTQKEAIERTVDFVEMQSPVKELEMHVRWIAVVFARLNNALEMRRKVIAHSTISMPNPLDLILLFFSLSGDLLAHFALDYLAWSVACALRASFWEDFPERPLFCRDFTTLQMECKPNFLFRLSKRTYHRFQGNQLWKLAKGCLLNDTQRSLGATQQSMHLLPRLKLPRDKETWDKQHFLERLICLQSIFVSHNLASCLFGT